MYRALLNLFFRFLSGLRKLLHAISTKQPTHAHFHSRFVHTSDINREEEGRDLLGKRTMDFKVTYLDGGLGAMTADRTGLLSDSDFVLRCQRNRRYKSQIKDLITNCRPATSGGSTTSGSSSGGKRKASASEMDGYTLPFDPSVAGSAAAAPVSYHQPATVPAVYPYNTSDHSALNGLSSYAAAAAAASAMPQNLFTAAMDHNSRSLLAPENFLHYSRHAAALGTYYPEYHHTAAQYPTNGFLEHMSTARSSHHFYPGADAVGLTKEDKLYACAQLTADPTSKYHAAAQYPSNCFLEHMSSARSAAHFYPSSAADPAGPSVKEKELSAYASHLDPAKYHNGSDHAAGVASRSFFC